VLEWFGILLPLAFHAVYGTYIIFTGKPTISGVPYVRNLWYILQRVSAVVILFFVMVHLLAWRFGPLRAAGNDHLFWDAMRQEFLHSPLFLAIYLLGFVAVAFHVGNGLWTFSLTWGIIVGERAQRTWMAICGGIGVILLLVQVGAVIGMMVYPEADIPAHYAYDAATHGAASIGFIMGGSIAGLVVAALVGIAMVILNRPEVKRAEQLL
jgi:succinate dehydrogenase/fumarate reductase cytochrome b subunit